MIVELRAKSQLTLPKTVCEELKLTAGDVFDVTYQDGIIYLTPLEARSKQYIQNLEDTLAKYDENTLAALKKAEETRASGVQGYSVDDFKKNLEKAIAEGAANAR
jgi:bifunctional DNA-binding transcriptional regulator/antitoxin component of YhaV-PrlF toxin-antitoxin module